MDVTEVHTEQGRMYLFVAVDRTNKVAFAELHPRTTRMLAAAFLCRVLQALPYKAHTVLTDNGVQFALKPISGFLVDTALTASAANTGSSTAAPSRRTREPTARPNA